jgi:hypothetical protein
MMFTNWGFHVHVQFPCFEDCSNTYWALCQVWASKELVDNLARYLKLFLRALHGC